MSKSNLPKVNRITYANFGKCSETGKVFAKGDLILYMPNEPHGKQTYAINSDRTRNEIASGKVHNWTSAVIAGTIPRTKATIAPVPAPVMQSVFTAPIIRTVQHNRAYERAEDYITVNGVRYMKVMA